MNEFKTIKTNFAPHMPCRDVPWPLHAPVPARCALRVDRLARVRRCCCGRSLHAPVSAAATGATRASLEAACARVCNARSCVALALNAGVCVPRVDLMSVGGQDGAATLIGCANPIAGSAPHVGTCAAPDEARERAVAHDWGRHFLFWSLVRCVCTRSTAYCAVRRVRVFVFICAAAHLTELQLSCYVLSM